MIKTYPTKDEVQAADRFQLCRWWRFLPSPGTSALDDPNRFEIILETEVAVMALIAERMKEVGGFTPEISKALGW